jgi:RNA polymerase sigma-70 factor (ECF subfamily)
MQARKVYFLYTGGPDICWLPMPLSQELSFNELNAKITTLDDPIEKKLCGLLAEVAAGHKQAFEELYLECSLPLYRVLVRILNVEAVAQEALQETFMKIWSRADQYTPSRASPMVWMTRIAKNQAIDTLRYQHTRIDHELDDSENALSLLKESNTYGTPEHMELAEALFICLDRLEDKPRYCVIRAYCEGYSHEELSDLTDSPIGTVKSWIRRSLKSLRRCLDEHG